MTNIKQTYNMETERVLAFIKSKLHHNSCRKADRPRLEDCKDKLKAGEQLDFTQTIFIKDLMMESRERSARYKRRMAEKKKAQKEYIAELDKRVEDAPNNSMVKMPSLAQFEEPKQTEKEVAATNELPGSLKVTLGFNEFLKNTPQVNKYLQTFDSETEEAKQDAEDDTDVFNEELPGGNEVFKPVPIIDYNDFDPSFNLTEYLKDEDPHTIEMNKTLYKRVSRLIEIAPKEVNAYLLNVNQISLISSGEPHILYLKGLTEHELAIAFMRDTGGLCDAKWKRLITEFYNGANGF
jgi:hypothetical protein